MIQSQTCRYILCVGGSKVNVIDWPCFLPWIKYIYMSANGSSLKLYLTALTLPKSSIGQYLSRPYISFQWMSDHTHFVSLSICLSIDLAFSRRIFHTLKLPLHPSQSRSYLHCEGDSNLGLICVGIYSGGFRLYFRSIRPHNSKHRCNPRTSPNWFPSGSVITLSHVLSHLQCRTMVLLQKNFVVLFNYYK